MWPRQHAESIVKFPRKEWKDKILSDVPVQHQKLVRAHLKDFVFKEKIKEQI